MRPGIHSIRSLLGKAANKRPSTDDVDPAAIDWEALCRALSQLGSSDPQDAAGLLVALSNAVERAAHALEAASEGAKEAVLARTLGPFCQHTGPRHLGWDEPTRFLEDVRYPFGGDQSGLVAYNRLFIGRYLNTLDLLWDLPRNARVLEVAATPYGMTLLLRKYLFESIELSTFGVRGAEPRELEFGTPDGSYRFTEQAFNAELDPWPYPDQHFDLVVCCEMVEHFALDPMHFFSEANRVLTLGGRLLVSTPNAISVKNAVRLVAGRPPGMAPHYRLPTAFDSIYLRHNRELTPRALGALFAAAGCEIELCVTTNNYPAEEGTLSVAQILAMHTLLASASHRGDTLNILGVKRGPVVDRYPTAEELYLEADLSAERP